MTLTSQIITDAFRQSNLLSIVESPTAAQSEEALRYLNRIVKSVFGNEAGEQLVAVPVGSNNISRPSGYPWPDVPDDVWFVPKNVRLVLNLEAAQEFFLHPNPDDGSRFAVLDTSNNLSVNNVTIHGNGRNIESSPTLSLTTDGANAEWFYRADIGNWQKYAPLADNDTFPFPEEFDDYFITLLAVRLNPAYGIVLDPQSQMILQRSRTQLRARYNQIIPTSPELALLRLPSNYWDNNYNMSWRDPRNEYNIAWPW